MSGALTSIREKLPMGGRAVGTPPKRAFTLVLGLIGLALFGVLFYIGFTAADRLPLQDYYRINVEVAEADNLTETNEVRIGARRVGQVSSISNADGKAVLELQLAAEEGPLLSDTRLEVRPQSPIGVRYVRLYPGTEGEPLENGATIPASQVRSPVVLDSALNTFDPTTAADTQTLLRELGTAMVGRGEGMNRTLAEVPQLLQDGESVAGAVTEFDGAVSRFISASEGTAAAFDPVREEVAQGFEPEARAFAPFFEEAEAVRSTLEQAPPTLQTAQDRLPETEALIEEVGGLARDAQPALEVAPAALDETTALMNESQDSLRDLDSTLRLAQDAVDPTLDLLDTVDPVLPTIEAGLTDSLPLFRELNTRGCDVEYFAENWRSMLGYGTTEGGFLRFNLVGGSEESIDGGPDGSRSIIASNADPVPCQVQNDRVELGGP